MKSLFPAFCFLTVTMLPAAVLVADDQPGLDAGLVYDMFASAYCDPVPTNLDSEALAEMRRLIEADEYPMVLAEASGFLDGEHFGISPYGFASAGRGFATVTTIWAEHEEMGVVALCLAMMQMGNQAVEPGSSRLIGLRQIDQAQPGDMLAAGFLVTLTETERLSDTGQPIYRLERVGEAVVNDGQFELSRVDEQGFEGAFELAGWVVLRGQEQRHPLTLQASAAGENVIERVPSLFHEEEDDDAAAPQAPTSELDRDFSRMPVPATTPEQRQRPHLVHDAPGREAFYNLLQIDLPRQADAVIEDDPENWDWLQGRRFNEQVEQHLHYGQSPQQVAHVLVELRDQAREEFAIVWDPDRRELAMVLEYFDEQGRYVTRSKSFDFDSEGTMISQGSGSMSTIDLPEHYRYSDDYGLLFGQEASTTSPEPAPWRRVVLERDAPAREAFYRLLDIDLVRQVEAGPDGEAASWEAEQKAAFEAEVAERFPADMPPQAVAERLMALRQSIGEVSALAWDPRRRSLIMRYEYPAADGFVAHSMDFVFNEAGEQVFFSVASEWRHRTPASFPAADDLGELFDQ